MPTKTVDLCLVRVTVWLDDKNGTLKYEVIGDEDVNKQIGRDELDYSANNTGSGAVAVRLLQQVLAKLLLSYADRTKSSITVEVDDQEIVPD